MRGRGPRDALLSRRRTPARLWLAVAALVACTIWLWSSSAGLTLTSYKAQVRPLLPLPGLAYLLA